jgi:hypothetical protein
VQAWDLVRTMVIDVVLGTDMKQHFNTVSQLNTKVVAVMQTTHAGLAPNSPPPLVFVPTGGGNVKQETVPTAFAGL